MTRILICWGLVLSFLGGSPAGASSNAVKASPSAQDSPSAKTSPSLQAAPSLKSLLESMTRFEGLYSRYLDRDPRQAAMDSLNSHVAAFNRDLDAESKVDADGHAAIEVRARSLDSLRADVAALKAALKDRPSAADAAGTQAYNERVARYNARGEEYRKRVAEHNEQVVRFNEESASRKEAMDGLRAGIEAERARVGGLIKDYEHWYQSGGDQEMGKGFKALFALVREGQRRRPADPAWSDLLARARAMRRNLADYAIRMEEKGDEGVIIVEAEIAGESCWLVLDTGAARVSITPELVAGLGLESACGDAIAGRVAGGTNTRGRALTLPSIRVGDAVATNVPAIELPEAMIGVDGLLGRSFLRQYEITIGSGTNPKVTLTAP